MAASQLSINISDEALQQISEAVRDLGNGKIQYCDSIDGTHTGTGTETDDKPQG